ncbi:MAG: hypothetical protein P8010_06810 [Desulfosarcinaceae bacterium]|jgi:hypothetical protein
MNKKYLLVLVIAVAIAGGLYLHIQKKKAADEAVHHAQQYERMLAMAQKSPMAGLTQMGAAINKYKADHQAYPAKLLDLYPQYVPSKEFLTEIQWDYRPSESDFKLSKSMVMGGKSRLASVNSTLMPQMESSVMVATKIKSKGKTAEKTAKPVQMQSYEDFATSMAANQALAKRQEAAYRARYRKKKAPVIPLLSQTVSFEEADEADKARANVVQGRFYCWKNDDGSYGYSNVQYPDRRKLEKFDGDHWMVVKTEFNHRPQPPEDATGKDGESELAALDRHKAHSLIVWRDTQGLIGFGNVQYPQSDAVEQYEAGRWTALSNVRNIQDDVAEGALPAPTEPQDIDHIAARNSGDYMVWQDEAGRVGFSNVQYPQEKAIQQYQAGEWVAVAPVRRADGDSAGFEDSRAQSDQDAVAAAASEQFIVWRDANGHIGISNVQPPVHAQALEIHRGGEWLAVAP